MPSPAYNAAVTEAARHHARSKTYSGRFLRPHKPFLVELSARLGCRSALDYGCGKGEQYRWLDPLDDKTIEDALGYKVAKYDPAWPPFAAEPKGVFDLVICTHVLGSIPLADLDWALDRLFGFAAKAVFICERIGDVKKTALSDPHLRPVDWHAIDWLEAILPHRKPGVEVHLATRYEATNGERFMGWWRP